MLGAKARRRRLVMYVFPIKKAMKEKTKFMEFFIPAKVRTAIVLTCIIFWTQNVLLALCSSVIELRKFNLIRNFNSAMLQATKIEDITVFKNKSTLLPSNYHQ